jgi:hypothetical protein
MRIWGSREVKEGRGSFLKKRTKKLPSACARAKRETRMQMDKSLFASFSSEKEDSF